VAEQTTISEPLLPDAQQDAPQCLRIHPQWLVWRNEEVKGRRTKVPYDAKTGRKASSTDPSRHFFQETRMAREKEGRDKPPLRPSKKEMAVRRAAKERIFAKYGLTSWQSAPDEALREYTEFLKTRTGGGK